MLLNLYWIKDKRQCWSWGELVLCKWIACASLSQCIKPCAAGCEKQTQKNLDCFKNVIFHQLFSGRPSEVFRQFRFLLLTKWLHKNDLEFLVVLLKQTQIKFHFSLAHQCSVLFRYYSVLKQTIFFIKFSNHTQNNLSCGMILEEVVVYIYSYTYVYAHISKQIFWHHGKQKYVWELTSRYLIYSRNTRLSQQTRR